MHIHENEGVAALPTNCTAQAYTKLKFGRCNAAVNFALEDS
jgi:hypothetical protein